jgi:hypothetical protein
MENRKYKVNIADNTGHTTVEDLSIEAAMETIVENAEQKARWVWINGNPFNFEGTKARTEKNLNALRAELEAVEDPLIMLTGKVQGGI